MERHEHSIFRRAGSGTAWRIAAIYAVISASWIFGSDLLLKHILPDPSIERLTRFQTAKGLFFVLSTAGLILLLIRDAMLRIRSSQHALEESEARFRRMVDSSPIGVFVSLQGKFKYVNRALQNLLGATEEDQLLGRVVLDFIHPNYHAVVKQRIQQMNELRMASPLIEERFRRLDGSYVWVEVMAIPLDYQGQPTAQVMVRDIDGQKKAESELHQMNETLERRVGERTAQLQEANEDLRTFSYMLSHDLRLPLRNITRSAEGILQSPGVGTDAEIADRARRIVAAAARLDQLILDLYEYNQLARTSIRLRRVSLILVVNELAGQLRREPEFQKVQINLREPMPWVLTHRPTLVLVLQNLMYNALVGIASDLPPAITIMAERRENVARLIVEDNGNGMEPARAAAVFDLFDKPQEEPTPISTGLGLAIVRRGVERMGGRAGVESAPGSGSRFWIELPLDPESP